jgi:hypothetical protein
MSDDGPRDKPITTWFRFKIPEDVPLDESIFHALHTDSKEKGWTHVRAFKFIIRIVADFEQVSYGRFGQLALHQMLDKFPAIEPPCRPTVQPWRLVRASRGD